MENKLTQELARYRYAECQAEDLADKIVSCLDGLDPSTDADGYMMRMLLPKALGKKMVSKFAYNPGEMRNPLVEGMVDGYVFHHVAPEIKRSLDALWDRQKDKEGSYNDADYYFDKYLENDKVRVSVVRNIAVCSDENMWVIIEDKERGMVHIRLIVEDGESDYPKERYPRKLSLQFYKDRDFIMSYVDQWHMTNKGGVYGDCRDAGYVLSFGVKDHIPMPDHCLYFYTQIDSISGLLKYMAEEVKK